MFKKRNNKRFSFNEIKDCTTVISADNICFIRKSEVQIYGKWKLYIATKCGKAITVQFNAKDELDNVFSEIESYL
jgi:hypothetical protein